MRHDGSVGECKGHGWQQKNAEDRRKAHFHRGVTRIRLLADACVGAHNLLNHKKAATSEVSVASPELTLRCVLFDAGEKPANQMCAEPYVATSSNLRVETAKPGV